MIAMASQLRQNQSILLSLPTEILAEIVKELRFISVSFSTEYPYVDPVHIISLLY
jgi:hypothetical protein